MIGTPPTISVHRKGKVVATVVRVCGCWGMIGMITLNPKPQTAASHCKNRLSGAPAIDVGETVWVEVEFEVQEAFRKPGRRGALESRHPQLQILKSLHP